ncbi:pyridoxal kinase [Algimonas arctica]|uniref:pyridoxal kinase n=1 Tax=Algimonas arctica TaxID=1479486 RepID=A0A8J3CR19_9PROT|nr:bifunctional hydroxymethylpyrimidine kinase/phosphomethylpyrimidine kinase [Algimonas arctica]GHA88392.1 pyridoxal kinase [Algimonas arctica]
MSDCDFDGLTRGGSHGHRPYVARILLISSFTATSHVGSVVSAFVLRRMGIDVTVLPTTLFGRHPGWGVPGGDIVPTDKLTGMWEAVQAQSQPFDAVMTGYMGEVGHIDLATTIIDTLRPNTVLVDPVMGDGSRADGGLYISQDRAEAICDHLIPRAHIATPNLWEWRYITGNLGEPPETLPRPLVGVKETLVTSVTDGDRIGALLFENGLTHRIMHERYAGVPNGGGDTLAAAYLGQRLRGDDSCAALVHSVSAVFAIMGAAIHGDDAAVDAGELPVIRAQRFLDADGGAPELTVETRS